MSGSPPELHVLSDLGTGPWTLRPRVAVKWTDSGAASLPFRPPPLSLQKAEGGGRGVNWLNYTLRQGLLPPFPSVFKKKIID